MELQETGDARQWYAIRTHPREEERANSNLRAWNIETFSPMIKKPRINPYVRTPMYERKPLFPRYIFARFDAGSLLRKILFTRGVQTVVSFGDGPASISHEIIALIQSQVGTDGLIDVENKLEIGDEVTIQDGPLRSLVGIFKRQVKGSDRVLILLAAINYQGSVIIERERVKKVDICDAASQV
jgi:transcriptional antiterminator RfaH